MTVRAFDGWKEAVQLIQKASRPLITTHVQPDGDAIGAEVAMAELLRALGSKPTILNSDPSPRTYSFLCRKTEPLVYHPEKQKRLLQLADLAILLDANYWNRAGPVGDALSKLPIVSLCLDHHQPREHFATVQITDPSASSTSELVYRLATRLKVRMSHRFREAIYAGILFDTGNFRFSNTNLWAHEIAGKMLAEGVSSQKMYERLFESGTWARIRLFGLALKTLRSECGGRIAWLTISRDMFRKTGAFPEDVEGFVDWVRNIQEARLILMFRDHSDGLVKGSLRSKTPQIDVNQLALRFGGGGHKRAAGVTIPGPLDAAAARVVREAKKLFCNKD